ncbi:hypothetical protein CsSME_00000629 [Camellia sinensis var. sinensis]
MTKKGSWISALKKALTPESKGKTDKSPDLGSPPAEPALSAPATPPREEEKLTELRRLLLQPLRLLRRLFGSQIRPVTWVNPRRK